MICERCKEQGLKSRIYGGVGYTTAMYCQPYYDEDGKYHHHDMNSSSSHYNCSNGHSFTVSHEKSCSNCDWKLSGSVTFHENNITVDSVNGTSGTIKING